MPVNVTLRPKIVLPAQAYCTVRADLSGCPSCEEFWARMEEEGWLWLDDCGSPLTAAELAARLPADASGARWRAHRTGTLRLPAVPRLPLCYGPGGWSHAAAAALLAHSCCSPGHSIHHPYRSCYF